MGTGRDPDSSLFGARGELCDVDWLRIAAECNRGRRSSGLDPPTTQDSL